MLRIFLLSSIFFLNLSHPSSPHSFPPPLLSLPLHSSLQAYVLEYNVYALDLSAEGPPVAITSGGAENQVIFGIPDWVYEGGCAVACGAGQTRASVQQLAHGAGQTGLVCLWGTPDWVSVQ